VFFNKTYVVEIQYDNKIKKKLKSDDEILKCYSFGRNICKRLNQIKKVKNLKQMFDDKIGQVHELKGGRKGSFSVQISGNWRMIFVPVKGELEILDGNVYLSENILSAAD